MTTPALKKPISKKSKRATRKEHEKNKEKDGRAFLAFFSRSGTIPTKIETSTKPEPQYTFSLLSTLIDEIKEEKNPTLDHIYMFKNEDQRFPWPTLEEEIFQYYENMEHVGCAEGESMFEEKEKELFEHHIKKTSKEDLLQGLETFQWTTSWLK